jgi:hypothetical protein
VFASLTLEFFLFRPSGLGSQQSNHNTKNSTKIKIKYVYPKASIKDVQVTGEALLREHPALQTLHFYTFFFLVQFISAQLDNDPAFQNQNGSMRIPIHNTGFLG